MNEEIINDYFKFTSKDKNILTSKDLENFESFISKSEFADIHENLLNFLNDLVYWSVQKLEVSINLKDEGQININVSASNLG
jgi:hypothetical protein